MVALGIEEPKQRPPAEFPPFAPEERDSVISKMLGKTMGGLQYVAETLDKPGRAARGLLAGKPYELLNLIPFSDTMGITDPAEAVSGRDLLEKAGAIRPNQPGLDFGDVAGFLGEIALDPTTYLGLGPLTQAGKAAAKTGILAPRLSQGLRSGERALLSIGAPKLGIPEKFIGTGAKAADFAEKNIDPLTDYLKYGNPVGRGLRAMFDNSTIGLHGEVAQKLANEMDPVFRKEQYDATIGNLLERMKLSKPDPQRGWMLDDDHGRAMLYGAEFATKPTEKAQFISQMAGGDAARHATLTQAADMGSHLYQQLTNKIPELNDIGLEGKELTDIIDYMYRQHSPGEWPNVLQKFQDSFRVKREEFARLPFLKGFPGGTNQVNDLLRDPAVLTGDPKSAVQYVSSIIDADPEEAAARAVKFVQFARKQTPPQIMQGLEQAVATGTNTDQWTQQLPAFFNVDPITNTIVRQGRHVQQMNYAKFKHELIRRTAQQFADPQAAADAGYVSVESALQKAGLTFNEAVEAQPGQFVSRGAHATAARNLGLDTAVLEDVKVPHAGGIATYKRPAGLGSYYVPEEVAADMKRVGEVWETPRAVAPILNAYDALLNFWKMSSTQVWPAFHARNLISGLYYQLVSGNHYPGARGMVDNIGDAYKVLFGQDIDPARLQMLGASSAGELQARAMAAGIIKPHGTQAAEMVGDTAGEFIDSNPYRQGAGEWAKQNLGGPVSGVQSAIGAARKLDPRGVAQGVAETAASSALAGRATGNVSEDLLRMAHWLGAKANGYDDLAAAMETKKWLFDYSELSNFEKSVMKRVFPFYCVPEDSEALTRDGWKRHSDLTVGEEIMTYSMERDCYEWQPCLEVATFEHDQALMTWENTHHKLRFTRNHRWVVQTADQTVRRPHGTYFYPGKRKIVTGEELNTLHNFKVASNYFGSDESVLTPEQARLVGWLMTDGYWRYKGSHLEAVIYQHPKKFLVEVALVAGGKPRKPHPQSGVVCVPVLRERVLEIKEWLDTSRFVSLITRLSRPALEAMYDAMYKGDGTVSKKRANDFIACQDDEIKRGIVVLCTLLGKRAVPNARGVCVSHRQTMRSAIGKFGEEHYSGIVWCPRTENGTWVMRQDRIVTITGNTFTRKNLPLVLTELAKNPGGAMAQSIRAANEPREGGGFVPQHISEGVAIPVPGGDGSRFITSLGLPFESAFDPFQVSPTIGATLQRNLEGAISQTNPLIKGGYTLASQREPFSGRPLEELYPYPTGSPTFNALQNSVMGTPTSRIRTLFDERKSPAMRALNLLTGVKVSDVSGGIENARQLAARKINERIMREDPTIKEFTRYYVPPGMEGMITPEQVENLRLQETLTREARANAKRRAGLVGAGSL